MARRLSPCGTVTAYRRHLRNGEEPCSECLEANRTETVRKRAVAAKPSNPVVLDSLDGSRLDDLLLQRAVLKGAMKWAREENPRMLPQISKELREVNREIDEVRGELSLKVDKFSGFFGEGGLSVVPAAG